MSAASPEVMRPTKGMAEPEDMVGMEYMDSKASGTPVMAATKAIATIQEATSTQASAKAMAKPTATQVTEAVMVMEAPAFTPAGADMLALHPLAGAQAHLATLSALLLLGLALLALLAFALRALLDQLVLLAFLGLLAFLATLYLLVLLALVPFLALLVVQVVRVVRLAETLSEMLLRFKVRKSVSGCDLYWKTIPHN